MCSNFLCNVTPPFFKSFFLLDLTTIRTAKSCCPYCRANALSLIPVSGETEATTTATTTAIRPDLHLNDLGGDARDSCSGFIPVVGNDKVGSLNTGNRDVGSDDVNNTVDTREIISRVKPDLLSRLRSVAAGAA